MCYILESLIIDNFAYAERMLIVLETDIPPSNCNNLFSTE